MADSGDYGRRRPRVSAAAAAAATSNATTNAGTASAAMAVPGAIGRPRIVYRGRVDPSSTSDHRHGPTGGGHGQGQGPPPKRAVGRSSASRGRGRSSAGRAAASAGGGSGGGDDDLLLARAGIQLSDRQRQLLERRRGGKAGGGGGGGNSASRYGQGGNTMAADVPTSTASQKKEGEGVGPNQSQSKSSQRTGQSPIRRPTSSTTHIARRSLAEVEVNVDDGTNSPVRGGKGGGGGGGGDKMGSKGSKGPTVGRRRAPTPSRSIPSSNRSPKPQRSSSSSGAIADRHGRSTFSRTGGSSIVPSGGSIVPSTSSSSSLSLPLSLAPRSRSMGGGGGGAHPPGHPGGGTGSANGNGGSTNTAHAHANANTNAHAPTGTTDGTGTSTTTTTPPRPRLARSASASSYRRRSALGVLDGNSPKRRGGRGGGAGGGGKRGLSKSPKRGSSLSKSPRRRGGSSTVALRRSTSVGRGSVGDRGGNKTASAHASSSSSALLVVHEDAPGTDAVKVPTEEELPRPPPTKAEGSQPAAAATAAALPPRVPDRAPSAPRGALRPPVYSQSKAGGADDASEQISFNINMPSQPTAALPAGSAEAKAVPLPVAKPTLPSTAGDNATDSDDEVDAGFNDFMNELMEEVAPDHTELWAGFQSSFGVSPRSRRPLHANSKVEAADADKAQKKKRLGPKAQETLSAIHQDLLENGPPNNYAGKAQLVNDRKVAKERRARKKKGQSKAAVPATPGPVSVSSSSTDPIQGQGEARIQFAGRTPAPPRRPQHEGANASRVKFAGRTPAPPRRSKDYDEDEHALEEFDTSGPQSPRDVPISEFSHQTPAPAKASSAASVAPALPPPTNQEPPWLVKLREKQRKLREEQPEAPLANSPTASVEKDPIEKLFGKRVVLSCKKRSADAAYDAGGSATPWNVKLRSTPAKPKEESSTPWQVKLRATPSKINDPNDSTNFEAKVEAVPFAIGLKKTGFFEKKAILDPYSKRVADPEEQWNPSEKAVPMTTVKRPDGTYKVHTQSYLNSSQPSYLLQRQPWLKPSDLKPVHESKDKAVVPVSPSHNLGITFGDTVHLNDLPVEVFGPQDETTSVQLCSADDEPVSVVIVGKDAVVKATRKRLPDDDEEGSNFDEATIAWCWHRADIRSLILNNEATCAELTLKRRSKLSLSFESAEECMLFAQAFYKLKVHTPVVDTETGDAEAECDIESEADVAAPTKTESKAKEESSSSPDPPSGEAANPSPRSKEDPPEQHQSEESDKAAPASISTAVAVAVAVAPNEAASQPGGRVLTEEEEFVLKQYHEGVSTASSVAASSAVPSEGEVSSSPPVPNSNSNSSTSSGPTDPRSALLAAIKGGSGDVKSKRAKFDKLSEEDEKIATKYRKMLSMGVPPPAVEHAMKRDQVSDKIVNIILNSGEAPKSPATEQIGGATSTAGDGASNLTEEEQEVAAKYQKMLKVSIPREAVRHKMLRDSISEKIRVAVLGPDADKATKSSGLTLSPSDEQIAAQYRKMLKISIPRDAVRNKMMRDNVGVKIIEAVLGKGATAKAANDVVSIVLTKEEEAVAAQYRKMIRFNIPKDAVRHKMMKDNVDARIIIAVVGDDEGPATAKKKKKSNNMVALHWTPLSPSALENSIWRATKKRKLTATAIHGGSDVKKLEELFQKKMAKAGTKGPGDAAADGDGKAMAKLIDLNRANIIAISLKAFQDFSHKELADTIANLDPNTKIVGERVQFLTGLLPNQTEVAAVKSYKGSDDRLVPAELFFKQLLSVPRLQTKVHVIQTMATFSDSAKETGSKFQLLKSVCSQVMESTKLQQVLEMVLHIGNLMNEGTRTGDIDGFKFDSLLKLTQTKSQDGKLTVLDYIVTTFIEKNDRLVLDVGLDFPECETAGRILISDLVSDARGLRMGLNKCRTELSEMKKDQSTKPVTRSQARKFAETPSKPPLDPRAGLFAAIKARGTEDEEISRKPADPRAAMLAAIKSRGIGDHDKAKTNDESQEPKQNFSPGVLRLECFLADASSELEALDTAKSSAVQACKDLSLYFGEGGSEKSAAPLLSVLSTFCESINAAVKGYEKRKALEEKRKAAAKKRALTKVKTPSTAKTTSGISNAYGDSKRKEILPDDVNQAASKPSDDTAKEFIPSQIESNQSTPSDCSARVDVDIEVPVDTKPNVSNGKSLVLMVDELLQTASPRTRREFQEGRTYKHAHTRLLKEIYQKEDKIHKEEKEEVAESSTPASATSSHEDNPRAGILTPIKSKKLSLESSGANSQPATPAADPRAAMLSSLTSRQVVSESPAVPKCALVDPREAMLSAIKARKNTS